MKKLNEDLWLHGLTIGEALRRVARERSGHEALVFHSHGVRYSYEEYDRRVDDAARGLLGMGIRRGDHVAVWSTNRPEWIFLQLATARIGAVLATVNPAFRVQELRYVLEQSDAVALFMTDRFKSSDYHARTAEAVPELTGSEPGNLRSEAFPRLRSVVTFVEEAPPGMLTWRQVLEGGDGLDDELAAAEDGPEPGDPINVQYTSGTTGFPKGAMLSHRNLLLNAWCIAGRQRFTEADRVCSPVPLYHCFGCVIGVLATMVRGATLLIPAEFFNAETTLDCIEQERATAIYGVPTMFIAMLDDPSYAGRDLSSLRTGVMAGAPCPTALMRQVIEEMGASEITIGYGMTETSPIATMTRVDDPLELRVETIGTPIPGVEVCIKDPVTGETLENGDKGEICIRGHNVMLGYYDMPEATAEAIDEDGWMHSGDLGVRTEDGYFRITGRAKDMIIRGGENIYPREIEEVLYRHPKVDEAEVVGVPDERFGEEVCAWVKVSDGETLREEEVRDFCKEHLAYFKVPRYVLFTEEFPTTVTGKVQKFKLRDRAAERIGRVATA